MVRPVTRARRTSHTIRPRRAAGDEGSRLLGGIGRDIKHYLTVPARPGAHNLDRVLPRPGRAAAMFPPRQAVLVNKSLVDRGACTMIHSEAEIFETARSGAESWLAVSYRLEDIRRHTPGRTTPREFCDEAMYLIEASLAMAELGASTGTQEMPRISRHNW